jgi:hypothetical protein
MNRLAYVGLLLVLLAEPAGAATLDQFSPYTNTSFNMINSFLDWQQEVVVGLSGPLVQVDLYAVAAGSCTFYITPGAPWQSGPPSFTTTFTAPSPGWWSVDTSSAGLAFQPGDHLVLGFIGLDAGLNLGGSWEPPNGGYPPGNLFLSGANYADGAFDVAFKTYVPEPAAFTICTFGALCALPRRRH